MSDESTNGDEAAPPGSGPAGETGGPTPSRRDPKARPSSDALRKKPPTRPTGTPPPRTGAKNPPPRPAGSPTRSAGTPSSGTPSAGRAIAGSAAAAAATGSAAKAGTAAGGSGGGTPPNEPPAPTPASPDGDDGPNRLLVGLGIGAAALVIVALIAVLLQTGDASGREGDAISTGGPVTLSETTSTTSEPTTSTTEPEPTTTTTTREAPTTTVGGTDPTGPAVTSTTRPPPTTRPTPTTQAPTPAELTVTCGGCSDGRMLLTTGGTSVIIINNVGGTPGAYSITATGEVEVTGAATGTVAPGAVTSVSVEGGTAVGDPPHGALTVSGPEGVILAIDVVIT